ncbi:sigma-70 family rna polymerase sigma factor : RNA polymerase sigma factor, sigma-70 family OS=Singulisphaera acidiphila (strain ATCC BAA-1392 / DSM 18658 / VKM B-2454 / MOB10) GN=Sinac_0102 PE=4 SV=1: Sigma70_r2: Sigma70_r4_2 [Gemmata massiliana]|uniref:ECF RNA polymerase sigma factor SigE n=1 Tax=Gemmata massiliana TaxID=1210884 RepID=A0A6P2CWA3_9BACT|nr:RNA polymerase sigma factor [Gemmata massiliana]VTR91382.1 sigma-70 family rna polymerase sigma factor : RNA polymerase sigma factor, sigma-70 family OS=Singulisphaera acidiphila (strain ATCC BAA-1392 / DSM 18658 / VKM B-2454 / MOB10) GN=Sinac_0102 PE=4 SV=1: Sigma70_r2: Sigma70_r4_2 [Gemmata massiliana]
MSLSAFVRQLAGRSVPIKSADAELLARFVATRDESAFAALVDRHTPTVLGACRRLLGHAQDAEDAAQAVFLLLARNADRVRQPAALGAWLHGVAVRVARKARSRRRPVQPLPEVTSPTLPPEPSWADARRVIDEVLAALPETLRAPLVLCYLEGLTRDEAAARLGWPLATLRGRLERGREKLRAGLGRRGFPLAAGLLAVVLESPAPAAPNWTITTTAIATGAVPPPLTVVPLSTGVLPVKAPLVRIAVIACLGLAAAGVFAARRAEPPPISPPKPQARILAPDPNAGPPDKVLAGEWRLTFTWDGATRTETLRFVDGKHLVWQVHLRSPGVDTSVTLRGKYELKNGELTYDVTERWNGEEPMRVKPEDAVRKYQMTWAENRTEFALKNKDSETVRTYRAVKDAVAALPAPAALNKIERTIKQEPKYTGDPRYLLLVFGAEAKFRTWVVLDGTTLYIDRNGNGDLTEDGEKFDNPNAVQKGLDGKVSVTLTGIDLTEPDGTSHSIKVITTLKVTDTSTYVRLGAQARGGPDQLAGLTNLRLAETAKEAQVLHFGGNEVTVRPSLSMPSPLSVDKAVEFRVQVGTPGIGSGSFASFVGEKLAEGLGPVAELEFTPLKAGDKPVQTTVNLIDRCCGDQFFAKVAVPDGVKIGVNAVKVTLSFPACPWGKVESTTHFVDVLPKQK